VDGFAWDSWEQFEISREQAQTCFWEFIQAADVSPSGALDFIKKWGLFAPAGPNRAGWLPFVDFLWEASITRDFLITLVATEHGELVPEQTLESFADSDREMCTELAMAPGVYQMHGPNRPAADANRRIRWGKMRAQGRGIDLQRRLLCDFLDDQYSPALGWTMWDERGRWNLRVEPGVENIVWSHLYSIFMSPQIDVYICSICGRPYEFDETNARRRPRAGTRAFCSEACRTEARRRSNRQSWARNSEKWRPRRRLEGPDGQAKS